MSKPVFVVSVLMAKPVFVVNVGPRVFQRKGISIISNIGFGECYFSGLFIRSIYVI